MRHSPIVKNTRSNAESLGYISHGCFFINLMLHLLALLVVILHLKLDLWSWFFCLVLLSYTWRQRGAKHSPVIQKTRSKAESLGHMSHVSSIGSRMLYPLGTTACGHSSLKVRSRCIYLVMPSYMSRLLSVP